MAKKQKPYDVKVEYEVTNSRTKEREIKTMTRTPVWSDSSVGALEDLLAHIYTFEKKYNPKIMKTTAKEIK